MVFEVLLVGLECLVLNKLCVSDLELMFPSVPPSAITVVTVTQRSSLHDEAQQESNQLLDRVSHS